MAKSPRFALVQGLGINSDFATARQKQLDNRVSIDTFNRNGTAISTIWFQQFGGPVFVLFSILATAAK